MPNSSIKAPLVPEPSSREITLIVPLAALATVANAVVPITAAAKIPTIFLDVYKRQLQSRKWKSEESSVRGKHLQKILF